MYSVGDPEWLDPHCLQCVLKKRVQAAVLCLQLTNLAVFGDGLDSFNPTHWGTDVLDDGSGWDIEEFYSYATISRTWAVKVLSACKLQDSQRQEAETPQIHEMVRIEKECWIEESGPMFESEWSQELHLCLVCFTQLDVLNLFLAIIVVLLQITWRVQSHSVRSQARDPKLRCIRLEDGNHLGFGRNIDKVLHLHLSTGLMCCFGSTK